MIKKHAQLVGRLYAGTILVQNDTGYIPEDEGLTEKEAEIISQTLVDIGLKLLKGHPTNMSGLAQITEYVYDLYYE